jgi:hypothetical protein
MDEVWAEQAKLVHSTRSQITESLLWLDGKRISLGDYPMHRAFYDGQYKKTLLKTCRQVGKSTTLANFIIAESVAIPFFKTLFFSPSQEQTLKFSNLRVGKTLNYSPLLKRYWVNENRVLVRTYRNGSENAFSYAMDSGDRLRGISADRLLADEIQDMVFDEVMAAAVPTLDNSDYQLHTYCGTPKTLDNPIESQWLMSTQTEWVMKCSGCNAWNYIDSEKNFKWKGPICLKCEKLLDPRKGQWVDFKPGAEVKGFHISQAIMPRNVPLCWPESVDPESRYQKAIARWKEIMLRLDGPKPLPLAKFRNEIVGVSDSQGVRLVTREDLESLCTGPDTMPMRPDAAYRMGIQHVAAGIDWSGGGKDMTSQTVLWIWGLTRDKKLRCLYYQVWVGEHPIKELEAIRQILAFYQPEVICCDAGEGNLHTEELRRITGWHHRIQKIAYGSGGAPVKWDPQAQQFSVNRTKAIDSIMMAVLRKEFIFPANKTIQRMTPAFDHVLAEFVETTRLGRKIWTHSKTDPDDSLHAMIFGRLAMQMIQGEIDQTA